MADKRFGETTDLRYLQADSVRCQAGALSGFRVCTGDSQALGSVKGVLISPSTRRCEFLVIEARGLFSQRRFLLPVEAGAVVEEPGTLKIAARKDELDLQAFTPSSVPQFSDEDLIAAMFSQDAA